MKNRGFIFIVLALFSLTLLSFITVSPWDELAINSPAPQPDYKMKDVSGKELSLNEIKTPKGLLVIFSCNTCPNVKLSEGRIKEYTDLCLENGIGCILVNSNEAQHNEDDSFDEMVKYYNSKKLKCA